MTVTIFVRDRPSRRKIPFENYTLFEVLPQKKKKAKRGGRK